MWDNYLKYLDSPNDEISPELKNKVRESYSVLRKELGEKFLIKHDKSHPIAQKVLNRAPWQYEDLVRFTQTLQLLKSYDSNYNLLIKKLRSRDRARSEGVPMVEVAELFLSQGLKIKVEPRVEYLKKPDLEIIDSESADRIFGELTTINGSIDRANKSNDYNFLFTTIELTPPFVHYSCRQHQLIDHSRIEVFIDFINKGKQTVINSDSFEVFENGYFTIALASVTRISEIREWCRLNKLDLDHVRGLSLDFDETKRIVNNKFREKATQIPYSSNGLLFIKTNPLYFYSDGVANSLSSISKSLEQFPNIIGVVVFSFLGFENSNALMPFDSSFLRIKQVNRQTSRFLLYVDNRTKKVNIGDTMLRKVISALSG